MIIILFGEPGELKKERMFVVMNFLFVTQECAEISQMQFRVGSLSDGRKFTFL
jgi:hypothetical protein